MDPKIFKAYDVRGTYPDQLNEAAASRITEAYVAFLRPKAVAVSRDVRESGPSLQKAVIKALINCGVDVIDIGAGPTELLYFAVGYYHYDGGIQVSASHNPAEWNGLKLIRAGAEGISRDTGLKEIQELAKSGEDFTSDLEGTLSEKSVEEDYFDFLSQFAQFENIRPVKIVANNNFGLTGPMVKRLLKRLTTAQVELIQLNFEPNGKFPKGPPSPQLVENRAEVSELIRKEKADFGVSWDPDGDRCFFADETGEFIQGCHLSALFAEQLLTKHPGEKIIYDATNTMAPEETITRAGGVPLVNRVGHTFIKHRMKTDDALFGGENSGHSYFREFYYADNGVIPFLLFLNLLASQNKPVTEIFAKLRSDYPVSGEINFPVENTDKMLADIEQRYQSQGKVDHLDGLSVVFDDWRFNLRPSNTEPLLRLNVEARNESLCQEKTTELQELLSTH